MYLVPVIISTFRVSTICFLMAKGRVALYFCIIFDSSLRVTTSRGKSPQSFSGVLTLQEIWV